MPDRNLLQQLRELADRQRARLEPDTDLRREVLLEARQVDRSARSRLRRWLSGRRLPVVVLAVAIGGGSLATAAWLHGLPDSPESGIVCRSDVSLDSSQLVVHDALEPVSACQALWEDGVLPAPGSPSSSAQSAPPLTACVGTGGVIEVFPGDADICVDLGLANLDSKSPHSSGSIEELSRRLAEFNGSTCATTEEAVAHAQQMISELELVDWSVATQDSDELTSCAKGAAESERTTVYIFYAPRTP